MNPTQELNQKVLQRYGWSAEFSQNDKREWVCCIRTDLNNKMVPLVFRSDNTDANVKKGTAAASAVALKGLRQEIARQEAKPIKESLSDVFCDPITIYESNEENWAYFWSHKPVAVGIDVEGNQISPPVLVQVSTDDYTILEAPEKRISQNLARLLADQSIVKVFCDNLEHKDKKCLGISNIPSDLTVGHLVDLEALANKFMGKVAVARGLTRIVTLTMPDTDRQVLIRKPKQRFKDIGRFSWIEQGKAPPLRSIWELSDKEQQYAALDAWCTLQAYKRFQE